MPQPAKNKVCIPANYLSTWGQPSGLNTPIGVVIGPDVMIPVGRLELEAR